MKRVHSLLNHRRIFQILFLKLAYNPQTNFTGIDAELKQMCAYLCVRECACVSGVCIFVRESAHKLYFCVSVVCVLSVCVFVGMCVASLCFILPPGVQCSQAILKVRDDTVGEGSVITATPPSLPLSISPSLHLSFHVFSSLSCVALGMWTLLNFPPGG